MMKRYLLIFAIVLFSASIVVPAQDQRASTMTFVYIDHSSDVPVDYLCEHLKRQYKDARNYGFPIVFYLSNMKMPIIAAVNLGSSDGLKNFEKIIGELQERRFHDVDPVTDVNKITEFFNHTDFVDDNAVRKYSSMTWEFYVNQAFWDLKYNEKIWLTCKVPCLS